MSESTTPSLEDLRADWVWAQDYFGATGAPAAQYIEEFDRAIAKVRAEAKVEALREAADEVGAWGPACIPAAQALRARADKLEEQA